MKVMVLKRNELKMDERIAATAVNNVLIGQ